MKKDFGIALGLSIIAFLMRLPFCSKYLQHWDSVNYALSLEHYDVRLHQPHPPGYFLYSFLGKLVNLLTQDANAALVTISLISGALGIGALYFLGLRITNRKTAIVIAVLGLTSPLHWFESDVALNLFSGFLAGHHYCNSVLRTTEREKRTLVLVILHVRNNSRRSSAGSLLPWTFMAFIYATNPLEEKVF